MSDFLKRLDEILEAVSLDIDNGDIGIFDGGNGDDGDDGDDDDFGWDDIERYEPQIDSWIKSSRFSPKIYSVIIDYLANNCEIDFDNCEIGNDSDEAANDYENLIERGIYDHGSSVTCHGTISWTVGIGDLPNILRKALLNTNIGAAFDKQPNETWALLDNDAIIHYLIYRYSMVGYTVPEHSKILNKLRFSVYDWANNQGFTDYFHDIAHNDLTEHLAYSGFNDVKVDIESFDDLVIEPPDWQMYGGDKLLVSVGVFSTAVCSFN